MKVKVTMGLASDPTKIELVLGKDKELNISNLTKALETIIDSNDKYDYVDEVLIDYFNSEPLKNNLKELYGDSLPITITKDVLKGKA